jgi:hypothetical protein
MPIGHHSAFNLTSEFCSVISFSLDKLGRIEINLKEAHIPQLRKEGMNGS